MYTVRCLNIMGENCQYTSDKIGWEKFRIFISYEIAFNHFFENSMVRPFFRRSVSPEIH